MFLHVFITWLVANILHPLFILLLFSGDFGDFSLQWLVYFFMITIYSLVFSIPLLLMALLFFYVVYRCSLKNSSKYFAWIFLATSLPFLGGIIVFQVITDMKFEPAELEMLVPATVSIVVAIVIRTKQFFNLLQFKTSNDGADLV